MAKKNATKSIKADKNLVTKIPYSRVYDDGMIELAPGDKNAPSRFSMAYKIGEVPASVVAQADPRDIKIALAELLDGFAPDVSYQFYVVNSKTSAEEFLEKTLIDQKDEQYKKAVSVYNDVIKENAGLGHNNMQKDKYIIFSLRSKFVQEAQDRFAEIEDKAGELFKAVCGIEIERLGIADRLNLIYGVYNAGGDAFGARAGMDIDTFNLSDLAYMKLTSKDLVAPKSLDEQRSYVILNEKLYAKTFFINNFPSHLSDNLISDLTNVSSTMIYSSLYQPLSTDKGFEIAKKAVADNTIIRNRHDKATLADRKAGKVVKQTELIEKNENAYFSTEALDVLTDAKASDSKVYLCTFLITLFSDNLVDLERDTRLLTLSATKFAFQLKSLDLAQGSGLMSILPLANTFVDVKRLFGVDRLCSLNPLDIQSTLRENGLFYGINAINDNLILMNRKNTATPCGLITGVRNAGKSYQVKREIANNLVSTDDFVFLIANQHEWKQYDEFVQRFGGATITSAQFDPFKLADDYGVVDDGKVLKEEFLSALCAVTENYYQKYAGRDAIAEEEMLREQVHEFCKNNVTNAKEAASILSGDSIKYSSVFNAMRDMDVTYIRGDKVQGKRFSYFKVSSAASLLIVLERIWTMMIAYKKKNVSAWVYVDSIDEVLKTPEGAKYLKHLLSLANILQNPITIVVQNSAMFSAGGNSYSLTSLFPEIGYYKFLNQGPIERKMYADSLNIQPSLLPYITNSGVGKGLIVSSSLTVPFTDNAKDIATDYRKVYDLYK